MQERPLNFQHNEDPTPVKLGPREEKKLLDHISKAYTVLSELHSRYTDGMLDEGFKQTLLSLSESHTAEICKLLNYEGQLAREKEQRYKEIRSLNEENRALRAQLGGKVSNEDVRERIKNMCKEFREWWNIEGFGHVSDIQLGEYGVFKVTLSGMISETYYGKQEESEDTKADRLAAKGFILNREDGRKVLDCDQNRALLKKMLIERWPSLNILQWRSYEGRGKEVPELRDIEVFIRNLDDFADPQPPAAQEPPKETPTEKGAQ